ncbi:MAG: hypothetical protein K9K67_11205 [Bacteriovoracaceae bacterium]|nr:hypothetical protein [Bacteriovoracaceae bacterium]
MSSRILIFCIFFHFSLQARQSFEFTAGENVQVLSDKAYRKSIENRFEAVGNVIITQGSNSIYGEKATLSFQTGETEVVGNVRFVGDQMTMYGSRLLYNFNSQKLDVYNARILSDNYVVLGKQLSRLGPKEIYGVDAEYTTCRDCPESWSVFGKEVRITVGEYVRIKHAYIKVKGVIVMYVPYIILPIKKNRETGLLFPSFGLNLDEGARFQQPFFWAINQQADLTFTPSYFGNRGYGSQVEFRHTPRDGLWYQVDGLFTNDGIYLPGKEDREVSGSKEFRYLGLWEHHYFSGLDFNHHFTYNNNRDFDFIRDYQFFANDKILGPDTGLESFFELRKDLFYLGVEGGFRENQLFRESRDFDGRYVQVLPKFSIGLNPIQLIQSKIPGFNKITLGGDFDYTVFKQNNIEEGQFIRNARRLNAVPFLQWNFGQMGPVSAMTTAKLDYQYYDFPYLNNNNWFRKSGLIYETEFSLVLDKIFGLAYEKDIPSEYIKQDLKEEKKRKLDFKKGDLIGDLPTVGGVNKETFKVIHNSYRHRQNFKLKHIFLSDQNTAGNSRFFNQIQNDNGQFDPTDTIRSREFLANNETSKTTLPLNNTLELQWNNSLIKKSSRNSDLLSDNNTLRDNFSYSPIGYFNVSQGYDFYRKTDSLGRELSLDEKLTRLFIDTGFNLNRTSLSFQEYYFYDSREHISRVAVNQSFDRGSLGAALRYNSFRVPVDKFLSTNGNIRLSDLFTVQAAWEYDLETKRSNQSRYGVLYSPYNNCWQLQLDFLKTIAEKRFSFNFLINFNDNNFMGLQQQ